MGTPTQYCVYWSGWVRLPKFVWSCPNFSSPAGRSFRGRRPKEGNGERVDDLNGKGNDQGMGANGGVEGVNENVEGANGGAPDFSTIIAQQLQNLLPAVLAQLVTKEMLEIKMVMWLMRTFRRTLGMF
nr:hypothetical protein [Tanacetum cinerariifolium]